jgi:AmmeMemoRadiSam system protein A
MSSPEGRLAPEERATLLDVARRSIECGLAEGRPLAIGDPGGSAALRELRSSFVTLHREGGLRGCVGALEARRPLLVDVAESAYGAAFRDPRFPPLAGWELADLEISVSVLSALEPVPTTSEADLLARLRPRRDGIVLREGGRSATFLPAVWESLAEPAEFLRALKRKAGLPADHWSPRLEVSRYTVESFS